MTDDQKPIPSDRSMPPCRCPQHPDGALPEATLKLTPPGPASPTRVRVRPLAVPYSAEPGALVLDGMTGRIGVLMAYDDGRTYLRPKRGGLEWEADPRFLSRPSASNHLGPGGRQPW